MCGIAGIAALENGPHPAPEQIKAMCGSIVHRGPDEEGTWLGAGVALGMRRLRVIDPAGGSQPMSNEDGSVRVVFNGEIYNFRALREELSGRGHHFATRSDTEVLVHGYEQWGARLPEHLNGMFAFAIHDASRRKLLLARDHLGVKPLYVARTHQHLIWGSEVKALLACGLLERDLDVDALRQFLAWEYVPGRATLLRSVEKLLPGHLLEIDLDRPRCEPRAYWDVPEAQDAAPSRAEDWVERVDALLRDCVQRQLVADVPLGAFLSGGVDSSLVVAAMGSARTFSIGFEDPSYNELRWARRAAKHLGVAHDQALLRPDAVGLFETLMRFLDDPIGDFSVFPTYLVSKRAREQVTVALSGDGGDELFAGYETHLAGVRAAWLQPLPAALRRRVLPGLLSRLRPRPQKKGLVNKAKRFAEGLSHPDAWAHTRWRCFVGDLQSEALLTPEALARAETPIGHHVEQLFARAADRDPINRSLYVDLKSYLPDNILVKVDRMSMAVSLETRVPFLDPRLVELAFRIPGDLKLSGGRTKRLLKRVAERHLPRELVHRPKQGFSIPIKNWLGAEFRPLLRELLDPRDLTAGGIFQAKTVERWVDEHLAGVANHSHALWGLVVFEAWRRMWLEG